MGKALVVCYSRSGVTSRLGKELAEHLGADFERIEEVERRQGVVGVAISVLESLAKGLPSIRSFKDPRDYDLVVLGTPVWTASMASPIRSYLAEHRGQLPHMAFFAVMAGQGADDALRELQFTCRAPDAPTCAFTRSDVVGFRYARQLKDFATTLEQLNKRLGASLSEAADASTWLGDVEPAGRLT